MSSAIHSSSSVPPGCLTAPTMRLIFSARMPNRPSRNSRSAAMAWCTQASMSPTYLSGSCACSSMGRGRPPGPPRVRAVVNALRRVAWRICDSDARASLHQL